MVIILNILHTVNHLVSVQKIWTEEETRLRHTKYCAQDVKRGRDLKKKKNCLPQAAQQIIELQEAAQINSGLQPANLGRNTSLHDMKTVVKTWRNRLPIVSDDLSHWSSIFMWRQHHYQGTELPAMFDSILKCV